MNRQQNDVPFEDGVLKQTRINLLGARGIEGIIVVPSTGAPTLNWLMYDGHGNMVRTMRTSFALSAFQWRGVWGELVSLCRWESGQSGGRGGEQL